MESKDKKKGQLIGSKDLVELKKQIILGILYRTAALAFILAFVVLYFPDSVLSAPLISAAVILYVASIFGLILAGRLAKPLFYSLIVLAATVFVALLATYQEQYPEYNHLGLQIMLVGAVGSIHFLAKAYSDFTGVVTRALLISSIGFLYYSLSGARDMTAEFQLVLVAVTGLASIVVYLILSILKRSGSFVGNLITNIEKPWVICMAVAIIMTYFTFIRQSLMVLGSFGLTVIEWAVLCVAILLIFIRLRSAMPVDGGQIFGDEKKVTGRLHYEGSELKNATAKVEEFVRDGRKEGLIALMAAALIGNGVPVDEVQGVIRVIVDHEDEREPSAMFKWAAGNVYDANRKKRLKAVNEMMVAAVSAVDSVRAPVEKTQGMSGKI